MGTPDENVPGEYHSPFQLRTHGGRIHERALQTGSPIVGGNLCSQLQICTRENQLGRPPASVMGFYPFPRFRERPRRTCDERLSGALANDGGSGGIAAFGSTSGSGDRPSWNERQFAGYVRSSSKAGG